jgi:hypothetical protein
VQCFLQTVGVAGLGLSLMYMLQEKLVRILAPFQITAPAAQSTRCMHRMNIMLDKTSPSNLATY